MDESVRQCARNMVDVTENQTQVSLGDGVKSFVAEEARRMLAALQGTREFKELKDAEVAANAAEAAFDLAKAALLDANSALRAAEKVLAKARAAEIDAQERFESQPLWDLWSRAAAIARGERPAAAGRRITESGRAVTARTIISAARAYLAAKGVAHRASIAEHLVEVGVLKQVDDPAQTVSRLLSRNKDEFESVGKGHWALADRMKSSGEAG